MKRRSIAEASIRLDFIQRAFAVLPLTRSVKVVPAMAFFEAASRPFPKEYQKSHFIEESLTVWLTRLDNSSTEQG